jgi:hypothetical protein
MEELVIHLKTFGGGSTKSTFDFKGVKKTLC